MRVHKNKYYTNIIVEAVAGTLYRMAPRNRPRNIRDIMSFVIENAERQCVNSVNARHLHMTESEFRDWLDNVLKSCPEFCNLNLSQNEVDKGVSVDDESRPQFSFVSAYDVETEDSWKDDFIDLDAAIQNIYSCIMDKHEDSDCFLCDHSDDTETCLYCILYYKNYKNLYEHKNTPFCSDSYDGWCNTSCPEGIAVCCKDCNKKAKCNLDEKCDSSEFPNCSQYVIKPERKNNGEET